MATSKRDKRRAEIARLLDLYRGIGAPAGTASQRTIWMILARNGTKEGATRAFQALWKRYVDVNEFRVAKPVEIAAIIKPHVKNDPIRVAMQLRAFLRRYFRDQHTLDFTAIRALTPEQLRKYLAGHEEHAGHLGLAIFFNLAEAEEAAQAVDESEEADKSQKRNEREVASDLDRMRMACAFAAYGGSPSKAKLAAAHRNLAKAWGYAPLPALPEPAPAKKKTKTASKKKKKTTSRKATARKTTKKKTAKKTTKRGGGRARPRTTPTKRKRTTRKSSRR